MAAAMGLARAAGVAQVAIENMGADHGETAGDHEDGPPDSQRALLGYTPRHQEKDGQSQHREDAAGTVLAKAEA